jgi:hypothetical protein
MKKDTKPYELLLEGTKANLKRVRTEMLAGATLDHVYHELQAHEQIFSARLTELKEWNKGEEQRAKKQADTDRAAKLEATKVTLLATPREELVKMAAGNKAVIDIKAETTIAEIVDAILKTAPETI